MINVDKETLTVTVSEQLSWDAHVESIYMDILDDIKDEINNFCDEYDEDDLAAMKEFVAYELTNDDRCWILSSIADDYDYDSCASRDDYVPSIFDEDYARNAVYAFIEEEFGIDCR